MGRSESVVPKPILKISNEKEEPTFISELVDTCQTFPPLIEDKGVFKGMIMNWRLMVTIIVPIVLSPLLFLQDDYNEKTEDKKFKCAYVVILMIVSWMLQLLPIGITSLMPFLLFPAMGVLDAGQVSKNYVRETIVLFVGGIVIALAVEYSNLHRRIALRVMRTVGCSPERLTLGTMMTTAFLSMWINNTATAGLAIPIVSATVEEIFPEKKASVKRRKSIFRQISDPDLDEFEKQNASIFYIGPSPDSNEMKKKNLTKTLLLAVCLAASIGGTGVITGSASNLVFQEHMKSVDVSQNGKYLDVTFATWILYNIPPFLVNLFLCWIYLVTYFNGPPDWLRIWRKPTIEQIAREDEEKERHKQIEEMLKEKYNVLGPISFHESAVLLLFVVTILLWFFRNPGFMTGWAPYLPGVEESTVAILVVFLFFIIPRPIGLQNQVVSNFGQYATLLDWKYVQESVPWGLVLLLGGGFAMSDGVTRSGLSRWIGTKLMYLNALPNVMLLLVLMAFTVAFTTVASNSATASTMLALLTPLSKALNIHPLYLTLPTTVACSYAFLLPVSTPVNALVYQAAGEELPVKEMAKVMIVPNLICVIVLFFFHISYGNMIFHFDNYVYNDVKNMTNILVTAR